MNAHEKRARRRLIKLCGTSSVKQALFVQVVLDIVAHSDARRQHVARCGPMCLGTNNYKPFPPAPGPHDNSIGGPNDYAYGM